MKKGIAGIIAVALLGTLIGTIIAEERDAAKYAGMKSCKMCHKSEKSGNQFGIWESGPHANAYKVLGTDEAKAVGKKHGVEDPQSSPKCLKCHSTAYNWTESKVVEKIAVEEGVTCESCHGPGKDYKSKSVMEDREKSIAAGMIFPPTKSCTKCHNETSATWNPERYTTADGKKVGFDEKQAVEKIKHPVPAK